MRSVETRDIIFPLWLSVGKDQARTLSAIEATVAGLATIVQRAGKTLISSSLGGQSFNFQLPGGMTEMDVIGLMRRAWVDIKDMTDNELESWLESFTTIGSRLDFSCVDQ